MLICKTRCKVIGTLSWIAGGQHLYLNSFIIITSEMIMKWMVGGYCIFDVEEENDVYVVDDADVMIM